jgi:hypothetical protein
MNHHLFVTPLAIAIVAEGDDVALGVGSFGVGVFAGNTQDASTVPEKIAQLQRQYGLKEIILSLSATVG